MQILILLHVIIIEYWCIGTGMSINSHVLDTDPVDHHFGNCHQMVGGSHAGLTIIGFDRHPKAGLVKASNYHDVGNNKHADGPKKKKQE